MKPTRQMMNDAEKLRKVRAVIDEKQSFKMKMPDGSMVEFSGAELIRTGEAFAELLDASNSGNDDRMRAALKKVAAIDCDA